MKKLLALLFLMTMAVSMAFAQQDYVTLTGHVINQETGIPVAGQPMFISVDSINFPGYTNQVFTDSSGFYTDQIPYMDGVTQGQIVVSTIDCNGQMVSNTAGFYPGMQQITIDFNIYCNAASGCQASFFYQPASNDMLSIAFIDQSTFMPDAGIDNWYWDFGDGNYSSEQNPIHSYSESGLYNACLYISSDDSSCYSNFCLPVDAGFFQPDSCMNYFWYTADSTGNGYLFEGWAMNSPVDIWMWDFGDGTTATGQSVMHVFADTNTVHNVCLTTTGFDPGGVSCTAISCQEVFNFIPTPCESSFWYYPDSLNAGFTFKGWVNNTQIESWFWEFGDGTTATGQTVSHAFANPDEVYNVCLTTTGTGPDGQSCTYTSCQDVYINIPSPCENYFEAFTNDGNTYSFSGYVMSGVPADYFWDFGDGTTATGQQVTHTFQFAGTVFNLCLTTIANDPVNDTCTSTSCQVIFPGGGSSCEAIMSAIPDSSGYTYYFENLSQGEHSFIFWDFGDGGQSSQANPTYTYAEPGIYIACLTIGDSLNNCWDQTCLEIWVNAVQPDCQASFFAYPGDSLATSLNYLFINTSTPGYTSQQWAFGDGTGSMDPNPMHTYANPGIYNACLTIWDSTGNCQSTYCMEIYAGVVMGDYTLSGNVIAGNALADQGTVWLIGANNYYYAETTIDSAGTYNFGGVPAGSYYIYAMLTPGSSNFFDYLPTYYTSSLTWQGATIVSAGEPNGWYPINLVSSSTYGVGNASISGTISMGGTFKSGGAPAANVEIILFNSTGLPITYTFSNSDGAFAFSNLPYGEYTIQAEMTGKTTEALVVILSEGSSTANVSFVVNETFISVLGENELDKPALEAGILYPNPVGETLYLELSSRTSGKIIAEIIDLQGRIIHSEILILPDGSERISIATGDIEKGIYLLRLTTESRETVLRKFVR